MCCFSPIAAPMGFFGWLSRFGSPPRVRVAATRVFARVEGAIQHLVYSMSLSTPADVAMVLPLPVAPALGESALEFVDLAKYPLFFSDLEFLLNPPLPSAAKSGGILSFAQATRPRLKVHAVGAFEASFVPTLSDFDRLDPRFRIPDEIWAARPEYSDHGFAVFKLKQGARQSIHPMAMRFTTRDPGAIFFPTVHLHDAHLRPRARFDHSLFYQLAPDAEGRLERPDRTDPSDIQRSFAPASFGVDPERSRGLIDPDAHVHLWPLRGRLANTDTRVRIIGAAANARAAA